MFNIKDIKQRDNKTLDIQQKTYGKIKKDKELCEYLNNKFNDSKGLLEQIYKEYFNIVEKPVCKICGNPVKFYAKDGYASNNFYTFCCSHKCNILYNKIR